MLPRLLLLIAMFISKVGGLRFLKMSILNLRYVELYQDCTVSMDIFINFIYILLFYCKHDFY